MNAHRRVALGGGIAVAIIVAALVVVTRDDHTVVTEGSSTTTSSGASPSSTISTSTTMTLPTATSSPHATTTAPLSSPAVVIRRGDPNRPVVALTFDAGSDVGYAADILDTLRANGITASFGMTGAWAERHPELVLRMIREGHQLLNHSYDHPSFTGASTGTAPLSRGAATRSAGEGRRRH